AFLSDVTKAGEEAVDGRNDAHIGSDGLDNDGGDFVFVLREKRLYSREVVIGCVEGKRREGLGHAWAFGDAECGEARTCLREEAIGMAVVPAFELKNKIALGDAADEAHGAHGGLGATRNKTNLLDGRDSLGDQRREFEFQFGGGSETGAASGLFGNGVHDSGMRVAKEQGAPGADIVKKLVAIYVVEIGAS